MITITNTEKVIDKKQNIYKKPLLENTKMKDWIIDKMEKYGSVENYNKQRESAEDYFKRIGWK